MRGAPLNRLITTARQQDDNRSAGRASERWLYRGSAKSRCFGAFRGDRSPLPGRSPARTSPELLLRPLPGLYLMWSRRSAPSLPACIGPIEALR